MRCLQKLYIKPFFVSCCKSSNTVITAHGSRLTTHDSPPTTHPSPKGVTGLPPRKAKPPTRTASGRLIDGDSSPEGIAAKKSAAAIRPGRQVLPQREVRKIFINYILLVQFKKGFVFNYSECFGRYTSTQEQQCMVHSLPGNKVSLMHLRFTINVSCAESARNRSSRAPSPSTLVRASPGHPIQVEVVVVLGSGGAGALRVAVVVAAVGSGAAVAHLGTPRRRRGRYYKGRRVSTLASGPR